MTTEAQKQAGRLLIGLLVVTSILLRSPGLFLLAMLVVLVAGASALWWRFCLAGVSYRRRFGATRLLCGEATDLWVEIANAKPLPLAWLKAEDEIPAEVTIQRANLSHAAQANRRWLNNALSLRWYELVRRHYRVVAESRGAFEFGPALVSSGDLFGFRTRYREVAERQTLLVYPKIVPLEALRLRPAHPFGDERTARRISEDPLRLAGARDYQPGDSIRHIHWKATARRGGLQTKIFEPSAAQQLVIFLNSQTLERRDGVDRDRFETAVVVAASLAHAGLAAGCPVGLFTNGGVKDSERRVRLLTSRREDQETRLLETLAQLSYFTFLSFEALLHVERPSLPYGATVLAVSAVVSDPILIELLDLRAAGHPTALIVVGQSAANSQPTAAEWPAGLPVYHMTQTWPELRQLAWPA